MYDIKLVNGDFNVLVGKENIYMEPIGKHSLLDATNVCDLLLISFAASKSVSLAKKSSTDMELIT